MKIIDLLNKIANGEEIPKKIKFRNIIYKWIERDDNVFNYKQEYNGRLIDNYLCDDWFMDSELILTDEVEILEEEKKIPNKWEEPAIKGMKSSNSFEELVPYIETIMRTQNDILDYLKSKGDE